MLPKILKPFHSDKSNLVRIGPKKDGGYVIDKRVIEKSEVIITCGLNDDWEFERDFLNKTELLFAKIVEKHKYIPVEIEIATFTSWK